MNEIMSYIAGKVLDALPAFLLRLIFKPKKVADQIKINLKGEKPICFNLGHEVPSVDLYFEITNFSDFNLTLDRLLIDLWFGQPTLKGAVLRRYKLAPRGTSSEIAYRSDLSSAQVKQIKNFVESNGDLGQIHFYITAYFESKLGIIEIERSIERHTL